MFICYQLWWMKMYISGTGNFYEKKLTFPLIVFFVTFSSQSLHHQHFPMSYPYYFNILKVSTGDLKWYRDISNGGSPLATWKLCDSRKLRHWAPRPTTMPIAFLITKSSGQNFLYRPIPHFNQVQAYPHMLTNFGWFILIFNKMALIILEVGYLSVS